MRCTSRPASVTRYFRAARHRDRRRASSAHPDEQQQWLRSQVQQREKGLLQPGQTLDIPRTRPLTATGTPAADWTNACRNRRTTVLFCCGCPLAAIRNYSGPGVQPPGPEPMGILPIRRPVSPGRYTRLPSAGMNLNRLESSNPYASRGSPTRPRLSIASCLLSSSAPGHSALHNGRWNRGAASRRLPGRVVLTA